MKSNASLPIADHPFLPRIPKSADPVDPLAALAEIADFTARGEALPAELGLWLSRCLRRVLNEPGVTFEEAVGLKVKNGGRSIAANWHKRKRDELIQTALPYFGSQLTIASTGLYLGLTGAARVPEEARECCQALLTHCEGKLPGPQQIYNVSSPVLKTGI